MIININNDYFSPIGVPSSTTQGTACVTMLQHYWEVWLVPCIPRDYISSVTIRNMCSHSRDHQLVNLQVSGILISFWWIFWWDSWPVCTKTCGKFSFCRTQLLTVESGLTHSLL